MSPRMRLNFVTSPQVRALVGASKVKILNKRPRESTDLEEYIVLELKNII